MPVNELMPFARVSDDSSGSITRSVIPILNSGVDVVETTLAVPDNVMSKTSIGELV